MYYVSIGYQYKVDADLKIVDDEADAVDDASNPSRSVSRGDSSDLGRARDLDFSEDKPAPDRRSFGDSGLTDVTVCLVRPGSRVNTPTSSYSRPPPDDYEDVVEEGEYGADIDGEGSERGNLLK